METPFTAAPPPQSMAHPAVQISYDDDDDILMDYDDGPSEPFPIASTTTVAPTITAAAAPIQPADAPEPMQDLDTDALAPTKVFLAGVDSMSTTHVRSFVSEHFTASPLLKVEWIDDSTCCLVYRSPEEASSALAALALDQNAELQPLTIRSAKLAASHPDSRLEVRIARMTDKKIAGARDRSRYYLFNPEEDRVEQAARLRREREDSRRNRSRRNHTDDEGEYDRRPFTHREHDRRRNLDAYPDSFYDDGGSSRSRSRNVSATRSRNSRDRSYSPERRRRSRSPIELFPNRSRNRSRELFPERIKNEDAGRLRGDEGGRRTEPVELFARRPAASSRFSVSPARGPVELFPGKLEDRIAKPVKKSLEERINLEPSDTGYRIKGRGGQVDDGNDLFAQKLRAGKGEGLVVEEGGRRRGGSRRNRAEDMFG